MSTIAAKLFLPRRGDPRDEGRQDAALPPRARRAGRLAVGRKPPEGGRNAAVTWLVLGALTLAGRALGEDLRTKSPSFLDDVAPILINNCIGCHSPRKAEHRYDMTTFDGLVKGGAAGEGTALEPGDPDASVLVEVIRPGGAPQMPRRLDPLKPEQVALIERWVAAGARYDGDDRGEDWVARWYRRRQIGAPETYPHATPVVALAFSPDGTRIVASGSRELTLWQLASGTIAGRLRGLPERVEDIAFSPDGRWLAIAGGDPGRTGSVEIWKSNPDGTGESERRLAEANDSYFAVAFSPDGTRIAAAGSDRVIRIFEVASWKPLEVIQDHSDWVVDLAFSPDGRRLASASRDGTGKVFDFAKGATIATFAGHASPVHAVAFGRDGSIVATGGADGQVRLWNPDDDGRQVSAPGGLTGEVLDLRFGPDGKSIIASGNDGTVRVFAAGVPPLTLPGKLDWAYTLALSPDGQTLASGGGDGGVRFWDLERRREPWLLDSTPGHRVASP
ncbi:c-type cytochrome domain-containing protein [Singulisphaera sp. Ch08]|uniref:C-type cytochrome domain-containing protein n=1 Tax=Singulisphaera sp. Ch08 TaxID=3120278 RepID=A0AAU7C789_9BACT